MPDDIVNPLLSTDYPDDIVNPLIPVNLTNQSGANFFGGLLSTVVAIAIMGGGLLFVGMLIIGSLQWIASGGDKGQAESARTRITHALTGLVVLLSLFALIKLVEVIFGISILSIDITNLVLN